MIPELGPPTPQDVEGDVVRDAIELGLDVLGGHRPIGATAEAAQRADDLSLERGPFVAAVPRRSSIGSQRAAIVSQTASVRVDSWQRSTSVRSESGTSIPITSIAIRGELGTAQAGTIVESRSVG